MPSAISLPQSSPAAASFDAPISGIVRSGLLAGCSELIGAPFSYTREEEVYGEGEAAEFVYKVLEGAVRTYKLLSDGRRQITGFHLPRRSLQL